MHRFLLVIVCILTLVEPASAMRRSRCRTSPCCAHAVGVACGSPTKDGRVDPCYCIKEEIENYPIGGGLFESRYLAERHDDGCPPMGDCQAPVSVYITGAPELSEEECSLDQCNSRVGLQKSNAGLEKPVGAGYKPNFPKPLNKIAKIIHTDYLVFESREEGWIRAIVHIVWLPEDMEIRPGQPARMVALGYEVEEVEATKPTYEVEWQHVHRCDQNECQYYVNVGSVTYAVMTVK